MRMIFAIVLALIALGSSAHANGTKLDCGDRCQFYKHGPNTGLRPAVNNMVCFTFDQEQSGPVEFMLYGPNRSIIRKLKRSFGTRGEFCIGSQFVRQSVFVEICNDFADHPGKHSNRGIPSLTEGLRTGVVNMCLLGKACPRYVAQQ